MMTTGRASANMKKVDCDPTKLGKYCWTKVGGLGNDIHHDSVHTPQQGKG